MSLVRKGLLLWEGYQKSLTHQVFYVACVAKALAKRRLGPFLFSKSGFYKGTCMPQKCGGLCCNQILYTYFYEVATE